MEIEKNLQEVVSILKNSQFMELKAIAQEAELFEATRVFKNPKIIRKVKEIKSGAAKDI